LELWVKDKRQRRQARPDLHELVVRAGTQTAKLVGDLIQQ
jgi:hypothetical protein